MGMRIRIAFLRDLRVGRERETSVDVKLTHGRVLSKIERKSRHVESAWWFEVVNKRQPPAE